MNESMKKAASIKQMIAETARNLQLGDDPYEAAKAAIEMGIGSPYQSSNHKLLGEILEEASHVPGVDVDLSDFMIADNHNLVFPEF